MIQAPAISIVIPTLRRPDILTTTLESIARCDPPPDEVIVVDGDDVDESSSDVAAAFASRLPLRYMTSPPGLPRQRNLALQEVTGEVVVFFDDDVQVAPEILAVFRRAFAEPSVLGVTGKVIEKEHRAIFGKHSRLRAFVPGSGSEGSFTRYGYPRRLVDRDTARDIDFMHGSCMAVRTDAARALGFDEALPGYALGEDEDFSFRLSRRGRVRYESAAVVHHAKSGATGADARRFGRQVVVNRHYLFHKNFSPGPVARFQFWLFLVLLVAHRLLNREWQGALGLIDGMRSIWSKSR